MPVNSLTDRGNQWPELLSTWASTGAELAVSRSCCVADWKAAKRMIEAVRPKLAAEAERMQQLLAASRKVLAPFEDPFAVDLGLHRWLACEREEAYSDWLEWIVRQARTPERVFKLFGLGPPPAESVDWQPPQVERELPVPHGHIDQEGRLDLEIHYGHRAIVVVEVKLGTAEDADTAKQEGYRKWLASQNVPFKHAVLLAVSAEEEAYGGFTFLRWAEVCIEMRLLAIHLRKHGHRMAVGTSPVGSARRPTIHLRKNDHRMAGAMVLAFVAAIEQNLLGFSAEFVHRICNGTAAFFNATVVDHIERFLKKLEL